MQATTIAGASFSWGGGIIQRWNFLSGNDLILAYQGIYGTSVLLCGSIAERTLVVSS